MTIHKYLCPKDNIDRLYVSRKGEEKGFTSIENCVDAPTQGLKNYIKKIKERLAKAANNNVVNISTDRKTIRTRN